MNYLQLCQALARESRTVSGDGLPASVTGQTGRLLKMVEWIRQAWIEIQNHRPDWLWMEDEFSGETVSGIQRYSGDDFSLTRFADWKAGYDDLTGVDRFSVFKTATGQADERPMIFIDWPSFRGSYLRGAEATRTGYPAYYSVDPQRRLVIYPIPDDAYTVRGIYRKDEQTLQANTDTPEMPSRFHYLIVLWALMKLAGHDESMAQPQFWVVERRRLLSSLERDQMPMMREGPPLA